jgi:hypothetical protein
MGLAVAAVCVLVSRLTDFEPGYLYGIICGVAFSRDLAKHEEGHLIVLNSMTKVVIGIAAWFSWYGINHFGSHPGAFFGTVLAEDFLASLFVSGLVSTVISLLPLRFLPGHKLQSWHRGAWLATFGISLFVLVQVLLRPRPGSSGHSHVPIVTTLLLFVVFGIGSVLFNRHFSKKHKRAEQAKIAADGAGSEATGEAQPEDAAVS